MMEKLNEMINLANDFEVINGKKYSRKSWSDLTKEYPGKWIIYTNPEYVKSDKIFICTVLAICDDYTINSERVRIVKEGVKSCAMKTDEEYVGGCII